MIQRTWAWAAGGGLHEIVAAPEMRALDAAVRRFCATPRRERHAVEVGAELRQLRHLIDLLEFEFSTRADAYAATDEYVLDGSVSATDWIRHQCKMSGRAAENAVCVGEQQANLPLSAAALNDGDIGFGHLALLAGTARALTASSTAGPFDERPLLEQARGQSVGRFRHDCAHARHAADAKGVLDEHVKAVDARYLELQSGEDGAVFLRGFLDSVGGATLRTALEPLARFAGANDHRLRGKRMADALVELAHHGLDAGVIPAHGGQRTHLQVTSTVDTLIGRAGAPAGELQWSSPIPAAAVQRLACDAGVTRVLLDSKSAVIDVGRSRRLPSAPMRRALQSRDRGCIWPGCDRPPGWTAAHHVLHWAHDGKTDMDNLVLLCHRHHWMVHEGGWNVVRAGDGRLLTFPPRPAGAFAAARAPDQSPAA